MQWVIPLPSQGNVRIDMGLFSKAPKPNPNPRIIFEGIEVTFEREYEWWEFTYRGTDFCSLETTLSMPTKAGLDSILETVEALKPEMRRRLSNGLREWGDAKLDDGESYCINIQDVATDNTFFVSWSDGASWGDLGVDFTIKGHEIIDDSWGD